MSVEGVATLGDIAEPGEAAQTEDPKEAVFQAAVAFVAARTALERGDLTGPGFDQNFAAWRAAHQALDAAVKRAGGLK